MAESADDFSIAGFRLTRQLGSGRFGDSWLGEADAGAVVVKILHADPPDRAAAARLVDEATAWSALRAPQVARLYGAGALPDGRVFLLYEHGGELSMADVLRAQARLSPPRALDVCAEVAEGLHAGHQRGLLHRDLKAANVGLWQDAAGAELARVLDFPTWHLAATGGLREVGALPLSSAATISPEEARGEKVDLRADLYALGVVLYQSLTGRLPVTGMTAAELLRSHRDHPALSLRDAGRKLPQLEELIARLLRKLPGERPSSAREVAEQMRALAPQVEDEQHPRPPRAPSPPPETPLPPDALTAYRDEDSESTDASEPVTGPIDAEAPGGAAGQELGAAAVDPEKTPPGGFAAPGASQPAGSRDLPTPPQGTPIATPLSTRLPTPAGSARPAPPPPPPPREPEPARPQPTIHNSELDPDRTPPDPVLATLEELPASPKWVPQQADGVARQYAFGEQQLPSRPAPPPPQPPPAAPTAKAAAPSPPPAPPAPTAAAPAAQLAKKKSKPPAPADGEERSVTAPGRAQVKPLKKRGRGEKVAFSSGRRQTPLEKQLFRLGVGLILLLGVLVLIALKVMASDDSPKKRAPQGQGAVHAPKNSQLAEGSE